MDNPVDWNYKSGQLPPTPVWADFTGEGVEAPEQGYGPAAPLHGSSQNPGAFLPTYSPQLNPIELAFGSVLAYLRAHSNDPRYLLDDGYYDLLDDAFRSIDYRKASSFISHMYTELAKVHCPGPAL